MGAFDFAMGTLSFLSSAFSSPKRAGKNVPKLNELSITLDDNARRAISEFTTGMRMLHKHSSSHGFNIATVARQNLKLLHTNLSASNEYRKAISMIRFGKVSSHHWTWVPLSNDDEIASGLLYLPDGHTVAPYTSGANVAIHQNELHLPFSTNNNSDIGYQLYLGLVGNTHIEYKEPITITSGSTTTLLKRGDTFSEEPPYIKLQRLTSGREPSLLLNVHIKTFR